MWTLAMIDWVVDCELMNKMPFKYQILVTPLSMIIMLSGLVWFSLANHGEIDEQNEIIRQWGRVTDRLHIAIGASERMLNIAKQLQAGSNKDADELSFSYLEQSRIFSDNVLYSEIMAKISVDDKRHIIEAEQKLTYRDKLDTDEILSVLNTLKPRLESLYTSLWAQKREAYIDYYDNFQIIGSRLSNVSLSVLLLCVFVGVTLSYWTITSTRKRLGLLSVAAQQVCSGKLKSIDKPFDVKDELDELQVCLSDMTDRLINIVAVDKILEGSEEERKRIAMDIHDQTLSSLTAISRKIEGLSQGSDVMLNEEMQQLLDDIDETGQDVRRIIDDLHPRTLDILGLEPAIKSFLKKRASEKGFPRYYLSVENSLDNRLSSFARVSLYRIASEVINNVIRHAECTEYEIQFRINDDCLIFSVEDNGIGLPEDLLIPTNTRGVFNITERAKSIGATVSWKPSRFSTGTRFELVMKLDA